VAVDLEAAVDLLDGAIEATVDGVVLQQVHEVVDIHEGVVDGHDAGLVGVLAESRAEDETADSTEAVDTHADV